jgi:antibiotic biosynthesis monooxygenase (ABM) superfamily enzyme
MGLGHFPSCETKRSVPVEALISQNHPPKAPSKLRFAAFFFLGVYPLVSVLQALLAPLTSEWHFLLRNLVFVPIMVVCMVWGVIPFIQTRLRHLL